MHRTNYFLGLFFVACTVNHPVPKSKTDVKSKQRVSWLQKEAWFPYIDSVQTIQLNHMKSCDSITIYYMSDKAPEVISRPKYVIWNAEGKYRQGECDFFRKSGARFIQFFHSGKSSISSTSFAFSPMKSPQANEESLFVLGQASEGSCYEISKVNQDGEKPRLNIEIHDVCMDTYLNKMVPLKD